MINRGLDWLRQAQDDWQFAFKSLDLGHYNQICFISQQAAEKALKALAFSKGAEYVKSHSATKIAQELGLDGEIEKAAKHLDQFYISSRYPDALPGGAPFEVFTREQAKKCLDDSQLIIEKVVHEFQ